MKGSDIFIMIPVSGNRKKSLEFPENDLIRAYIDKLKITSEYECDKHFAETIEREPIGSLEIAYTSDEYDLSDLSKAEWIDAYCCYVFQKISGLGLIQIFLPTCEKEDTQIGDIVSTGNLICKLRNQKMPVDDFVAGMGLAVAGKKRVVYCNSLNKKSEGNDIAYLLAGETACSEHVDYRIRKEVAEKLTSRNISKYDFYEMYASQRGLVYLFREFGDDNVGNIERESLLLYICEVAVLQNAAISRINNQIVDELMQNSNISAKKTLRLQVEFGKTILLWDNAIYNYYLAQELSNEIVSAFGTDKLLAEYERNSAHIEQIASLKSGIASELEGKILNVLAFILSISQLFELGRNIWAYLNGNPVRLGVSGAGAALLLVLLAIIWKKRRN